VIRVGGGGPSPFVAGGALCAVDGPGPPPIAAAGVDGELAKRHTPMPTITRIETTTNAHPGILGV
jgi:hypothetical protein